MSISQPDVIMEYLLSIMAKIIHISDKDYEILINKINEEMKTCIVGDMDYDYLLDIMNTIKKYRDGKEEMFADEEV